MARLLMSVVLILSTALFLPGAAASTSWKAVKNYGKATALFRNSHSTAMAELVEYHGLKKPRESTKTLVATCWVYAQYCECDKPDEPIVWRIAYGLKHLCAARGYPNTPIKERCRYSKQDSEKAGWSEYVAAIKGDRPVLLTFCYDTAAKGLSEAKRRGKECFSVVGIGYLTQGSNKFLICHDGITTNQKYAASVDKVSASDLGVPSRGRPWGQSGTSLYKWDGSYKNLVMVFVGKPTK